MFTPEQLAAYEGPNCPFCGSRSINGKAFDCDERAAWQKITCSACGKSWQDIYHRDAIADLEDGRYNEQPLIGKTNIDLSKVDWKLLREQKATLFGHAGVMHDDQRSYAHFHGLLELLDHLMDEAAKTLGEKLVFGK
jgi:DNA-directed RNA polymerase subunit RPC12/RpoP